MLRYCEPIEFADIDHVRFRRHWVIRRAGDPMAPNHWRRLHEGMGFALDAHPDLLVVREQRGALVAFTLGTAVDPSRPTDRGLVLRDDVGSDDLGGSIPKAICGLAGAYVVVVFSPGGVDIYTDPAGMMGVYYSDGAAASCPGLLPGARRDPEIDRAYPLTEHDNWYLGDVCPFVGVKWLLANHCLSLPGGRIRRFWPEQEPAARRKSEAIDEVLARVRGGLRQLCGRSPVLISLTGGRDSRINLAAAADLPVECFTASRGARNREDVAIAGELAKAFGVPHELIHDAAAPPWLFQLYDEMMSSMVLGSSRPILGACRTIASSRYVHVSGNLGAIAKGFFWPRNTEGVAQIGHMTRDIRNQAGCILEAADRWMATVPPLSSHVTWNLMYLEQRGGRWMGPGEMASGLFYAPYAPFCDRRVFESICGLPLEYQRSGRFLDDLAVAADERAAGIRYASGTSRLRRSLPTGLKVWGKRILRRLGRGGEGS